MAHEDDDALLLCYGWGQKKYVKSKSIETLVNF